MTLQTLPLSEGRVVRLEEAGSGEALVLIHGVGMQSAAWAPQIGVFAKTHRVIAVNMPGHGGSSLLPDGARLPDYVNWLAEVLRKLAVGPVNLAGHSMGALITGGFAVEHPDLLLRAAVLNGVFRRSAEARAAVSARADAIAAGAMDIEAPLNRWFGDSAVDRAARNLAKGWLEDVAPAGYAAAYRAFAEGDDTYASRWSEIRCPVLVLTGDGDANSTTEMAAKMATAAPLATLCILKGQRHMVNMTAPEAVNRALADWLKQPLSVAVH